MDFLDVTIERNPLLIQIAAEFHQAGEIPANTVVIDLDAVRRNAAIIKEEAQKHEIQLYFMTKQFGRNPQVCSSIQSAGIEKAVAVDMEDAWCLFQNNVTVGHLGHLVQIPSHEIRFALESISPEVITVFSYEKAKQIAEKAKELGITQQLLVRVVGEGDFFYPYQYGGIPEREAIRVIKAINRLEYVTVVGVTSFPCFRFDLRRRQVCPLPNLETLTRTAREIKRKLGITVKQINAPGDTSARTMELLAEAGVTHGEPGHAFTGTTPWHAFEELPEIPSWLYVSEVSHKQREKAYCFGGGLMSADAPLGIWTSLYHHLRMYALVGHEPKQIIHNKVCAEPAGYIDYYGVLDLGKDGNAEVGDTVIYGVRNQVFVSRAYVAIVSGIQKGRPVLQGIYDRKGRLLGDNRAAFQEAAQAPSN